MQVSKRIYEAVDKQYDASGHILAYRLGNKNGYIWMNRNELKDKMRKGQLEVVNLQLTSDNRLVEQNIKKSSIYVKGHKILENFVVELKKRCERKGIQVKEKMADGNIAQLFLLKDYIVCCEIMVRKAEKREKVLNFWVAMNSEGIWYLIDKNNSVVMEVLQIKDILSNVLQDIFIVLQ